MRADVSAGSTVVKIGADTMDKLGTGTHTVTVKFDDGEAELTVTVNAAPGSGPDTGDDARPGLWLSLMGASLVLLGAVLLDGRRERRPRHGKEKV